MKITSWNEEKAHELTKRCLEDPGTHPMSTKHSKKKHTSILLKILHDLECFTWKIPWSPTCFTLKSPLLEKEMPNLKEPIIFRWTIRSTFEVTCAKILRWIHPPKNMHKKDRKRPTCTKKHLNGMVEWPFYGAKWPPTRGWKGQTLNHLDTRCLFYFAFKTRKLWHFCQNPCCLILASQCFSKDFSQVIHRDETRIVSIKPPKSRQKNTRKDGAKNLSFCYMDKLPFFLLATFAAKFRKHAIKQDVAIPPC